MLPKKSVLSTKSVQPIVLLFPKPVPSFAAPRNAFRIICVLICAVAPLALYAQRGPTALERHLRENCEKSVFSPAPPPPPKWPDNIEDATTAALACEWNDPSGVKHVLGALGLLVSSSQDPGLSLKVVQRLEEGDPYSADKGLYAAAMGSPDANGQPTVKGLPNFLDMLAKANTLKMPKEGEAKFEYEQDLFACRGPSTDCTQELIDEIFDTRDVDANTGPIALTRIHESFSHKDNYVALYQLLKAYVEVAEDAHQGYVTQLEKLRAAFADNSDILAKQVAAKITHAKE